MFGRRLLVFALTFLLTSLVLITEAWAQVSKTPWEVTVVFLSSDDDDTTYQADIDANILELARFASSPDLKLTIARLWPDRSYIFQPDSNSSTSAPFKSLFESPKPVDIQVPGNFIEEKSKETPATFVEKALKLGFSSENSRRLLVIQTHGFGPKGVKQLKTLELKSLVGAIAPRLNSKLTDLLWMDSCFMQNLEFAVEFKDLADYIISSQDSEFSAGMPFEALERIGEADMSPLSLAEAMTQQYVGSYSVKREGSQKDAVFSSAATISVIDTSKLDNVTKLAVQLSRDIKKLSAADKTKLGRSLQTVKMELNHLVDFGRLLQKLKTSVNVASAEPLLKILDVSNPRKLLTAYRLKVTSDVPGAKLVFGYEDFTKGDETDAETLEKIPKELKPVGFTPGPNGKSWPYRLINKRLYLTPFAPGLNRFSYYLESDGERTPVKTALRVVDFVMHTRKSPDNPVVYFGYTQAIGKTGEKYTGLGVLNPLLPKPDLDYMKLEFTKQTAWGL